MASTTFRRPVIRLLIGLIVMGATLTFLGLRDFFQDAGGSHRDFSDIRLEEFMEGDVVHGTITDTLGCFMYHYKSSNDKKPVDEYYAIPFYDSPNDAVPRKIILYKTGNSAQMRKLEALQNEVYSGSSAVTTVIMVERADVKAITHEEQNYYYELVDEYVEAVYGKSYTASQRKDIKDMFKRATVPYIIQFHAKSAAFILPLGLGLLGVAIIVIVLMTGLGRGGARRSKLNYVPPVTMSGDLYSSPQSSGSGTLPPSVRPGGAGAPPPEIYRSSGTGTPPPEIYRSSGAGTPPPEIYRSSGTGTPPPEILRGTGTGMRSGAGMTPQMQEILSYRRDPSEDKFKQALPPNMRSMYTEIGGNRRGSSAQPPIPTPIRRDPQAVFYGKKNYSDMERPMPPLEGEQGAENTWQSRGIGQPNIYGSSVPPFVPPGRRQDKGDSMPSVDPHSEAHIDLSNGGVALEDRAAANKAQMPMNGSLPVINPDSADIIFEREIGSQLPEMPKAPEMPKVNAADENMHIKPLELKDRYSTEQFRVEPTEDYRHLQKYVEAGSGEMQSVDPYTEKNVDLSNGGRELPDDDVAAAPQALAAAPVVPDIPKPAPVKLEKPAASVKLEKPSAPVSLAKPEAPAAAAAPAPSPVKLEKPPAPAKTPEVPDIPKPAPVKLEKPAVSAFEEVPKVQDVPVTFSEIPKVQDIPTVQSVPTVQDVPKAADFPTVPDYSSSYAKPEFPTAPSFPDKIETPEFPEAPSFPQKDENGNYTF